MRNKFRLCPPDLRLNERLFPNTLHLSSDFRALCLMHFSILAFDTRRRGLHAYLLSRRVINHVAVHKLIPKLFGIAKSE